MRQDYHALHVREEDNCGGVDIVNRAWNRLRAAWRVAV
jgi:hypothetical protein